MFTGIITDVGTIEKIETKGDWVVDIAASTVLEGLSIGASIACNGICLTVIELSERSFRVQLSMETVGRTTAKKWHVGTLVNLERSLHVGQELGGHFVSGHVDGVARIVSREEERDSLRFKFQLPDGFGKYLAPKGSISLDGISLTVNEVEDTVFGVNIIPHTQLETNMAEKKVGDLMNFEIDLLARYLGQLLEQRGLA